MRLVLVTGASGVLGRRLLPQLAERGWRTRALLHERPVPEADEEARGSLEDAESLARAATGAQAVVHLAGLTHSRDPGAYERLNADATAALARAAEAVGAERLVHVSSRAISPDGGAYSVSKLRAEEAVRRSSVPWVIIRLAEVYGGDGREGVDRIVQAARDGSVVPIVGRGDDVVCPIHVDDAVAALAGALDASPGRTYTVGGDCLTVADFAAECRRLLGRGRQVRIPVAVVRAASIAARKLPLPLYPDQLARLRSPKEPPTPEAERELGFRIRGLGEGLRGGG